MNDSIKVLYFSDYEWDDRWRRKQRLAYEIAQKPEIASLLYVIPPVSNSVLDVARARFQSGHLGRDHRSRWRALRGKVDRVADKVWTYTGSSKTLPLTRVGLIRRANFLQRINHSLYVGLLRRQWQSLPGREGILWLCHPLQAFALDAFPDRLLVCYDWTDDWTQFEVLPVANRQELVELNDRILRTADIVFAVSDELHHRAKAVNDNSYLAPNATDVTVIGELAEEDVALELISMPRPIIGYIGQIGDKIDYELLTDLAKARPNWSFVLVGNVWVTKQGVVERLAARPNVHFMGQRAYRDLAGFLRGFDVCMLPHLCNDLTRSMDPIKLYDYLASGKPIVSTPVAGTKRFLDVLSVADNRADFLKCIEEALNEDGQLTRRRVAYARQNTWPQRAGEIWQVISCHLS
jgi:glycosyltransferase involved in cell wall biosynthesis